MTRQLRSRPFKVDDLQYKTLGTNDLNHLIYTPLDMVRRNGLKGNNWSATDVERHNLSGSLELLADIAYLALNKMRERG